MGREIHVINLDRSSDRLDSFNRRNSSIQHVRRFSGYDGRTAERQSLEKDGLITSDLDYSPGSLGCALSHIMLWRLAVQRNEVLTIAEDDAIFSHRALGHMDALQSRVRPEWDFIQWSASLSCYGWLDALPGGIGARVQFFTGDAMTNLESFQNADTEPALLRARHLLGLICYSVSPRGAAALLEYCLPLRPMVVDFNGFGLRLNNTGIDCIINGVMPSLKAYVCLPPLAISDETPESSVRINT